MEVQFKERALWKSAKEVTVRAAKALSSGISFEELYSLYTSSLRVCIPSSVVHLFDYFFAYTLFHLYLLYVLGFAVFLSMSKKFRLKGSGISPVAGALKEKAGMCLTYFFVIQSISRWSFGMPALDRLMGWAFQVKPQINFKPQIKIGKSKSAESVISVKSKLDADLHVGFESDDEVTRKTIKKLGHAKRNVEFAAEMTDAIFGQSGSEDDVLSSAQRAESVKKWMETLDPDEVKETLRRILTETAAEKGFVSHKEKLQ